VRKTGSRSRVSLTRPRSTHPALLIKRRSGIPVNSRARGVVDARSVALLDVTDAIYNLTIFDVCVSLRRPAVLTRVYN